MSQQVSIYLIDAPFELESKLKRILLRLPDVVLLEEPYDLSMSPGLVIVSTEKSRDLDRVPWVLFGTSAAHSLDAWQQGAIGFLFQPITQEQVENFVERARHWYLVLENLNSTEKKSRFFEVSFKGQVERIDVEHIIRLESNGNDTIVWYEKGRVEKRISARSLTQTIAAIEYEKIIQIDRKHAVNQDYIHSISGNIIKTSDGAILKVARRRMPHFTELVMEKIH